MDIRQAITTKYLGPTNCRGSRIKARAAAGSVTIDYPHALNHDKAHAFAASKLAERYGWHGQWFGGGLPSEDGYCFVSTDTALHPGAAFVIVQTLENVG